MNPNTAIVTPTLDNIDRISYLPDEILCHILSHLPTKYSVRTRILSTRWKYLFTLVPVLNFDQPPLHTWGALLHYLEFVNFVFNSYNVDCMDKFFYSLDRFVTEYQDVLLIFWLLESVRRRVQGIDIAGSLYKPQIFPQQVLISENLTNLKLYIDFDLDIPENVWLPRLKTLDLAYVTFLSDDSFQSLFRSCPVLEFLFLNGCCTRNLQVIDIRVPTLLILIFHESFNNKYELVLDVPNLKYFEYWGDGSSGFTTRDGFKSLLNARLISCSLCYEGSEAVLQKLINSISHVQGFHCDALVLEPFRWSGKTLPIFHNLTRLEIELIAVFDVDLKLFVDLLDVTPHLEVLILDNRCNDEYKPSDSALKHVPTCVCMHLKVIEFRGFAMLVYAYYLVEYFLKNAKVLNALYIQSRGSLKKQYQINKKLLTLPRCSRACQIFLNSVDEEESDFVFSL